MSSSIALLSVSENTTYPLYVNVILGLYMVSYIILVCLLVLFFFMFVDKFNSSLSFKSYITQTIRYRLRWVLISIFVGMAALPPSFFFFSKLSLLSSTVNFGGWFSFILFLGYIMFSWAIYYSVIRHLLFSIQVTSTSKLSDQRLSAKNAYLAVFFVLLLFFLTFFYEDVYLFVYWFLL